MARSRLRETARDLVRPPRRWISRDALIGVNELREEVRALTETIDRQGAQLAQFIELCAPGPERLLAGNGGVPDRPRSSRVLCSLGVGPYLGLLGISSITFEAFAARHSYDLVLATSLLAPERPPAWSKIRMVRDLLDRYEEVFWVDADAIFVDISKDIAEEKRPDKDLYLVEHRWLANAEWRCANTGVFFIRSTPWSRDFLDAVWQREQFIEHEWWENAAVLDLLGYDLPADLTPPSKGRTTDYEERVELLGFEWNSTGGASVAEHPRIRHVGRGPLEDVRRQMLEHLLTFRRNLSRTG
jgi:hypothetical protein